MNSRDAPRFLVLQNSGCVPGIQNPRNPWHSMCKRTTRMVMERPRSLEIGAKVRQSFDNWHLDGVGKPIRISFLPAGSEDTASSRIRVYSLQKAMAKHGVCAAVGFEPESDVVVVQKKITDEILNLAGKAKDQGAAIVYDVDDLSGALDYWTSPAHFAGILELADLITTDTEGHREFLMKNCEASRVE